MLRASCSKHYTNAQKSGVGIPHCQESRLKQKAHYHFRPSNFRPDELEYVLTTNSYTISGKFSAIQCSDSDLISFVIISEQRDADGVKLDLHATSEVGRCHSVDIIRTVGADRRIGLQQVFTSMKNKCQNVIQSFV